MSRERTPHIAVVATEVGTRGSVPWVAAEHCRHLSRHFRITAVGRRVEGVGPDSHRQTVASPDLYGLRRFGHAPRELFFALRLRTALKELHDQRALDFILCHSHPIAAWAAWPLKRKRGVPFGVVPHGDIFDRPRGTYGPAMTTLYRWATPTAYRRADLVVALSPYLAERARAGGAAAAAIEVIPNGVHLTTLLPGTGPGDGRPGAPTRFLSVGRLDRIKNLPLLLEAFARQGAEAGDTVLTIVGDGPVRSELVDQSRTLGIADRVTFRGRVEPDALPAVYAAHDVFCITSHNDVLPTVVLEAMRASLPVLGVDVGGIPFMVVDGKTGRITPPGDPVAFAREMTRLAADAALRRTLGRAGRERLEAKFAWPVVADRLAASILERTGTADRTDVPGPAPPEDPVP